MSSHDNQEKKLFEIIEGCIRGDRKWQQKLYETFYGKMLGVCLRYTKDREDALDVLQDGFVKVFTSIKTYGNTGSIEGWIRRIMINTAIDFFRRNKKMNVFANSEYVEHNGEEIKDSDSEDEEKFQNISPNEIMEAVQQLTPQYRTVFNMYVVDGFTHKEIAEQLGISEGTSKSNFAKARKKLKHFLSNKIKTVST